MTNEQLTARIRAGENESVNMLKLWQQNKGFIAKLAMKYKGYAELDDLQQEGYLGLCDAVRLYDETQGVPFINYAAFWIKQAMKRYIDNCCHAVRIPVGLQAEIQRYNRAEREYRKYYGCEPPERALCALLDVSREKLHTIQESAQMGQIRSLNEVIGGEEDDITISDTVASDEDMEEEVLKRLDHENMSSSLWEVVELLPADQALIIRKRYTGNGKTLKEVGEDTGLTFLQVKHIEDKAMRVLRSPRATVKYRTYYEQYLAPCEVRHVGVESFNRTWTSSVEAEVLGSMF